MNTDPTRADREAVEQALGDELSGTFGSNWEPTEHGTRVEVAIDDFLAR